jgi:hypothetical protein
LGPGLPFRCLTKRISPPAAAIVKRIILNTGEPDYELIEKITRITRAVAAKVPYTIAPDFETELSFNNDMIKVKPIAAATANKIILISTIFISF